MPAKKKTTPPAADQTAGAPAEQPKSRLQEFTSVFDVVADPKFDREIESQLTQIRHQRKIGLRMPETKEPVRWKRSAFDVLTDQEWTGRQYSGDLSCQYIREQYKLVLTKESKQSSRCRKFIQQVGDNAINGTLLYYQEKEQQEQLKQQKQKS